MLYCSIILLNNNKETKKSIIIKEIMKTAFSKFNKIKKVATTVKDIKDIDFTCKVVHTGRVLSATDVDNNRSSKYSYLAF